MEKSRSPGRPFSHTAQKARSAIELLAQLAASPEITILRNALGENAKLYLVGGTVRDLLLGKVGIDYDLATVFKPETVINFLEKNKIKVVPTGIEHGTVTAVVNGKNIELTTFRKPGPRTGSGYSESIEEDLSGRDFTVNAIAFDIKNKKLIDPLGGVNDLNNNLLRAVGNPKERFTEDPLRIIRMIRFGPAENRSVDPQTLNTATELVDLLEGVSIERITAELQKILLAPSVSEGLRVMAHTGMLKYVLPELMPAVGFEQNRYHTQDVFEHTLTVLGRAEPVLAVRLAALFHDIAKPHTLSIDERGERHFYQHEVEGEKITASAMKRLRFSKELTRRVAKLVRYHMRPLDCGPSAVRRLLRDLGEDFDNWRLLKIADASPALSEHEFNTQLKRFDEMVRQEKARAAGPAYGKLQISGDDLIALGLSEGPQVGRVLKELEELVIQNPDLNTKEKLKSAAKKIISAGS